MSNLVATWLLRAEVATDVESLRRQATPERGRQRLRGSGKSGKYEFALIVKAMNTTPKTIIGTPTKGPKVPNGCPLPAGSVTQSAPTVINSTANSANANPARRKSARLLMRPKRPECRRLLVGAGFATAAAAAAAAAAVWLFCFGFVGDRFAQVAKFALPLCAVETPGRADIGEGLAAPAGL
jgi:hypothetical protein